jgi:diguanylate cyclase (GGDEF)-like protein
VARFGGDEFVIVLEGPLHAVDATVLPAIERALDQPFDLGELTIVARSSLGVASVAAGKRVDAEMLLSRADATMYQVKHERRAVREASATP